MAVVRRWAALFVTAPTHKPRCRLGRVEGRRVLAPEREIASLTDLSRRVDDKPMAIERASLSLGRYLLSNHAVHSFPLKSKQAILIMEYYLSKLC